MDIIKKMIEELSSKDTSSIYLREIALLMEEIDNLKVQLETKEKLIKNYKKQLGNKNK